MMVFSLFESILGIKRYSFLGFSYNHWYDKWISLGHPDFLKILFFFFFTRWVGPCDIVARLAAAPPSLALEIPSLRFFLLPKKTKPATQATLETAQLYRELLRGRLRASLLFRKLCIGHTRVLGSTRVSWLLRNPIFRRYYYYVFHKRERTFAISCSWWVDDWLKSAMLRKEGGPQQIKDLHIKRSHRHSKL